MAVHIHSQGESVGLVVSVPGEALLAHLGELPEGVEIIRWDMDKPAPRDHIDIVVPPYRGTGNLSLLEKVDVRLVQGQSIGYDGIEQRLPSGNVFANAATVHETSTAELTLALILAAQRSIPEFVRAAGEGHWAPERTAGLADRRVTLLGTGGVGNAIAERLAPFEVELTRVATRSREDELGHVHGTDELASILPDTEILIVVVPLNEQTQHLVDEAFLAQLPEGALVVNVARGAVADTDAILREAKSGRLRFALDVVDPEPLPDGHPLFALPNVLISPHVGGATLAMLPRMGKLITQQIQRMAAGEEPLNVVIRT